MSSPATGPSELGGRFRLAALTGRGYDKDRPVAIQVLWMLVSRSVTMRWWCPNRLRTFILRRFGASIAPGVLIRHDVKIHWPWKLAVGAHSWIGEDSWLLNLEPISIGSDTCISQGVLLCTGSHDRKSPTFEFDNAPIWIGDSVWVAARATVLRAVRVHNGATIGATALVTRDVPVCATVVSGAGAASR